MLGKLFSNVPPENFHLRSAGRWHRDEEGKKGEREQQRGGRRRGGGAAVSAGCHRQSLKHVLLARSHVVKNLFASVAKASDEITEGQGGQSRYKGVGEGRGKK